MDTTTFARRTSDEYKAATRNHWTSDSCGSNYSTADFMSPEYFEEIEEHRYRTHPWILQNIRRFDVSGRDVLEVGYGMGTDHSTSPVAELG